MFKKVKNYIFIGIFCLIFGFVYSLSIQLNNTGQIGISLTQIILASLILKNNWLFSEIWYYTISGESYRKWTAKSVSNSNGVTTQWLCGNA